MSAGGSIVTRLAHQGDCRNANPNSQCTSEGSWLQEIPLIHLVKDSQAAAASHSYGETFVIMKALPV